MNETEKPASQTTSENLAGLRGGETSYAEQEVVAPIIEGSLEDLADNGVDINDISQVTSMLSQRNVKITPEIEALIRRKIEETEVSKGNRNKEAVAKANPEVKGKGELEDELAGIRGNIAAESEGMAAEAPPPPAKGAGQSMDMTYFSRMSDANKKK